MQSLSRSLGGHRLHAFAVMTSDSKKTQGDVGASSYLEMRGWGRRLIWGGDEREKGLASEITETIRDIGNC